MSFLDDEQLRRNVERLDLDFNAYGIDRFGASRESIIRYYSPLTTIYRHWSKVTTFGIENVPPKGRALLIGNHSGGIGLDASMTVTSLLLHDENPRLAQGMADYFFARWPFMSVLTSRLGALTGIPEHAHLLLEAGRLVMVFPEGARRAGKLYRDRYKLIRFGTGFMRLALETRTPIVPFAFVGGEEAFPTMYKIEWLSKALGAPLVPVAPQIVLFPLPVSCQIYFGEPMLFEGDGSESDDEIEERVDRVKASIAGLIERGLEARPTAFTTKRVE